MTDANTEKATAIVERSDALTDLLLTARGVAGILIDLSIARENELGDTEDTDSCSFYLLGHALFNACNAYSDAGQRVEG